MMKIIWFGIFYPSVPNMKKYDTCEGEKLRKWVNSEYDACLQWQVKGSGLKDNDDEEEEDVDVDACLQ